MLDWSPASSQCTYGPEDAGDQSSITFPVIDIIAKEGNHCLSDRRIGDSEKRFK